MFTAPCGEVFPTARTLHQHDARCRKCPRKSNQRGPAIVALAPQPAFPVIVEPDTSIDEDYRGFEPAGPDSDDNGAFSWS